MTLTSGGLRPLTAFLAALAGILLLLLTWPALPAHAASTIGASNEAAGETPQMTEFQVVPASEQAGGHGTLNIWMRFCGTDDDIDPNPAPPPTDFDARKISDASGTPIKITTQNAHLLATNDNVTIQRVAGNTAANTQASRVTVPVNDPTTTADDFEATHTFTIDGTSSNGPYVAGTGTASYAPRFGCDDRQLSLDNLLKDFVLSLPPGLLGNPTAVIPCPTSLFIASACPAESVVGNSVALAIFAGGISAVPKPGPIQVPTPLYVVDTLGPEPARLGTALLPAEPRGPLPILIGLRSTGDFGVDSAVDSLPLSIGGIPAKLFSIDTNLCAAVPCNDRTLAPLDPGTSRPFAVNPTSCKPATTRMLARPYPPPAGFPDPPGGPSHAESTFSPTGCDNVPFTPDVTVKPASEAAGVSASYGIAVQYPDYVNDPIWQSALRDAEIALPEGVSLSPTLTSTFSTCSEAQSGIGNNDPVACPANSQIGEIGVESPVLPSALGGKAFLGPPGKIFLVVEGHGLRIKLTGDLTLDAQGRVVIVMQNLPELPFGTFELRLMSGVLVNPTTCGTHTGSATLLGYSGSTLVVNPTITTMGCSTAPDCSGVKARPSTLRRANHRLRLVRLRGAKDADGDRVPITITAVTQDEPLHHEDDDDDDDDVDEADHSPPSDARRGPAPNKVFLRAERDRTGDGRVYRISFTASDGAGGSCAGVAKVGVPREKRSIAVDSAPPSFNSFGP